MTEIIRYNVNERGRQHRGQDRNFDLRALAALVNSPQVQEQVRNRDLVGYYGHGIRMKFGMRPPEAVLVDGKMVNLEPAIVTTYLRADSDGTIEHRTEFLNTASGKIAARMHRSRVGGFSSAISVNPQRRGNLDVPSGFEGFDYVGEPNYTTNRGYVFDSAAVAVEGSIFDFVMADHHQSITHMTALYDGLQGDFARVVETMAKLERENEELLSILSRNDTKAVFDHAAAPIGPRMVSRRATDHFARISGSFGTAILAPLERLKDDTGDPSDAILDHVAAHYGVGK